MKSKLGGTHEGLMSTRRADADTSGWMLLSDVLDFRKLADLRELECFARVMALASVTRLFSLSSIEAMQRKPAGLSGETRGAARGKAAMSFAGHSIEALERGRWALGSKTASRSRCFAQFVCECSEHVIYIPRVYFRPMQTR